LKRKQISYIYFVILFSSQIVCLNFQALQAQSNIDLRQGNADYPVPDPPALLALQGNSPSLLYPSTVRDLAISLNTNRTYNSTHTYAGIEFAPILIGNEIDLSEYLSGRLIRVLLRTRISVASEISKDMGFHGAIGLRWMLHDDADIRADSTFQKKLIEWGSRIKDLVIQCESTESKGTNEYYSCITKAVGSQYSLQQKIDSLRNALKNKFWNKSVFEIAFAAVYRSSNSQSVNSNKLEIQRYNCYMNYAFPMIGTKGQIVFGASGWLGHNDYIFPYQRQGAVIGRFCYGNISERFFLETKYAAANKFRPDWNLGIGTIMHITNGFWVKSGVGVSLLQQNLIGTEAYLSFSFGTPEIRS
jgi:hypothetical protein